MGRLVRERRETVLVATKIPPKNRVWPAPPGVPVSECFPAGHIVAFAERSLKNLGRDHVDLMQLHTWRDEYLDQDGWRDAFLGLKRAGKARFLGLSVSDHDPGLRAARRRVRDLRHRAGDLQHLRPLARARAASRLPRARASACSPACPSTRARSPAPSRRRPRSRRATSATTTSEATASARSTSACSRCAGCSGTEAATLPELALRFCLSHDAVSTVIPGMRRIASVEANAAAGDGRRLSQRLLEELGRHAWPRNFYS